MTKDEAIAQIRIIRTNHDDLNASQEKIREVIDQIDQPPGEFSVREMVELICNGQYWVQIYSTGKWYVCHRRNHEGTGIESLRAKLIELAKPPEPKTAPCDVPIEWLKLWVRELAGSSSANNRLASANAKAALEKAGVKL